MGLGRRNTDDQIDSALCYKRGAKKFGVRLSLTRHQSPLARDHSSSWLAKTVKLLPHPSSVRGSYKGKELLYIEGQERSKEEEKKERKK